MNERNLLLLVVAALSCSGCRQDMQTQPRYEPLGVSRFFPDGRVARRTPDGAIPFGGAVRDSAVEDGESSGTFADTIPLPVTTPLLERGEERFDIYCSPCHGRTGDGYGVIARRGFKIPADLNSSRVRNAPPGYLYQVIVNGYGAMDDYSYQIKSTRDRWAIVAYVRALELSRSATVADVPEGERAHLESLR